MTLRGEIDSFPLETVVQLIHSTNKTGQLEVRGSDASGGTLGFDGGRLVAAIAGDDIGEPALGAVFAVATGSFEFIPWTDSPAGNLSGDLDQLLDKAVEERDRIVAIRKVIPDDRSRFRLSERAADKGNITLSSDQWRTLLAVNGDRDVTGVSEHLKSGKLATRASLAALVDAGFIDVLEPAPEAPSAPPAPPPGKPHGPRGPRSRSRPRPGRQSHRQRRSRRPPRNGAHPPPSGPRPSRSRRRQSPRPRAGRQRRHRRPKPGRSPHPNRRRRAGNSPRPPPRRAGNSRTVRHSRASLRRISARI